jgi:hypothetical protein
MLLYQLDQRSLQSCGNFYSGNRLQLLGSAEPAGRLLPLEPLRNFGIAVQTLISRRWTSMSVCADIEAMDL